MLRLQIARKIRERERERETDMGSGSAPLCWFWAWACVSHFAHFPIFPSLREGFPFRSLEQNWTVRWVFYAFLNNRIRDRQLRGGPQCPLCIVHPTPPPGPSTQPHPDPRNKPNNAADACMAQRLGAKWSVRDGGQGSLWQWQRQRQLGPAIDWIYLHSHGPQMRRRRCRQRGLVNNSFDFHFRVLSRHRQQRQQGQQ